MEYRTEILERYCDTYGMKLEREYRFCPGKKYRADFAIPAWRILIEIEGGYAINGAHVRPKGFLKDMQKYNLATVYGWQLLRLTPRQFRKTQCVEWLNMWRNERGAECRKADTSISRKTNAPNCSPATTRQKVT